MAHHTKYLTKKAARAAAKNKLAKGTVVPTRIDVVPEGDNFRPVLYFVTAPENADHLDGIEILVDSGDDASNKGENTQANEDEQAAATNEGEQAAATPATPAAPRKPRRLPAFNFKPVGFVKKLRPKSKLDQLVTVLRQENGASEADIKAICTKKGGEPWGMSSITTLVQWDLRHKGHGVETSITGEGENEVRQYHLIEGTLMPAPPPPAEGEEAAEPTTPAEGEAATPAEGENIGIDEGEAATPAEGENIGTDERSDEQAV